MQQQAPRDQAVSDLNLCLNGLLKRSRGHQVDGKFQTRIFYLNPSSTEKTANVSTNPWDSKQSGIQNRPDKVCQIFPSSSVVSSPLCCRPSLAHVRTAVTFNESISLHSSIISSCLHKYLKKN